MKKLAPLALGLLLATGAFAQRGGMRGGFGGGRIGGGGGHIGGGGFRGGIVAGGGGFHGGFVSHGGGFGFHSGVFSSNPFVFNRGFGFRSGFGFGFGWGLPVYAGGYWDPFYSGYGYGYGYPYAPGPNVTVIGAPYAEPAPPVVVQAYAPPPPPAPAHPSVREYGTPEPVPQNETRSQLYLLAFKDGTIRAAVAYWVDGDTLHYVDPNHKQREAPLASIDREFSRQLNRERRVTFRLPE